MVWLRCRDALLRVRWATHEIADDVAQFRGGRQEWRPYTTLFLWVTKAHHVILHTYQCIAPLHIRRGKDNPSPRFYITLFSLKCLYETFTLMA